jgi:hypothetical protein
VVTENSMDAVAAEDGADGGDRIGSGGGNSSNGTTS